MPKKHVATKHAPTPIGPYSQGVIAGGLLFVSGQIPIDPATDKLVEGDIKVQTEQVLKNILAVLKEAKMGPENVVKASVFLADLADLEGGLAHDIASGRDGLRRLAGGAPTSRPHHDPADIARPRQLRGARVDLHQLDVAGRTREAEAHEPRLAQPRSQWRDLEHQQRRKHRERHDHRQHGEPPTVPAALLEEGGGAVLHVGPLRDGAGQERRDLAGLRPGQDHARLGV